MAGLAGVLGTTQQTDTVEAMLNTMEHRGPDSVNVHRTEHFHGGVRASTLSAARGDGFAQDGELAVLFDGDIYNERKGQKSDAEVALELF